MRIALLSPLTIAVPPIGYGAVERVLDALGSGLVAAGHEVTLFAVEGPRPTDGAVQVRVGAPEPVWESTEPNAFLYEVVMLADLRRSAADEFDLIHAHASCLPLAMLEGVDVPLVTTLYGRLYPGPTQAVLARFQDANLAALSRSHRGQAGVHAERIAVLHPGLPLVERYTLGTGSGGYLAFLGRITPDKGVAEAVEVARRAGLPLRIAGAVLPGDELYFANVVQPAVAGGGVEWVGELDDAQKNSADPPWWTSSG